MDWANLANIASVVEAVVVIFAAIYGVFQLREAVKGRNLSATIEMIELLGNDEFKDALANTVNLSKEPSQLSAKEWKVITKVAYPINRVGALMSHKMIDQEIVLELYAETINSAWKMLKPYIEYRRVKTHQRWVINFERAAVQAQKFQKKYLEKASLKGELSHEVVGISTNKAKQQIELPKKTRRQKQS